MYWDMDLETHIFGQETRSRWETHFKISFWILNGTRLARFSTNVPIIKRYQYT